MNMDFARITGQIALHFANQEALVDVERNRRDTANELIGG